MPTLIFNFKVFLYSVSHKGREFTPGEDLAACLFLKVGNKGPETTFYSKISCSVIPIASGIRPIETMWPTLIENTSKHPAAFHALGL